MLLPSPLLANTRDRPPKIAMKKNVNTYVPTGKSVFYANFRVKVNDLRTGARTIQVNRATGLPDRCTAQAIANRMRDDVLLGFFDVLPRLRELPDVRAARRSPSCHLKGEDAREVAKDFLTLVADRGRACAVASRSPPGPQGPNSSSRCRYSPNPARLRQSLPSRCRSVRPTAPRHVLHSRSNDAQSGIKPCAILVEDCFRMRLDLVDLEHFHPYARFELDINTRLPL